MSHEEVSAYEAYIAAQAQVNACEDIRDSVPFAIAANTKFSEWRKIANRERPNNRPALARS